MRPRAPVGLVLLLLVAGTAHAASPVALDLDPAAVKLYAGSGASTRVTAHNTGHAPVQIRAPAVHDLPQGIGAIVAEGPGGRPLPGGPDDVWVLDPDAKKEWTLTLTQDATALRANTSARVEVDVLHGHPAATLPLAVLILTRQGAVAPEAAPPGAWGAVAALVLTMALTLAALSDAGRLAIARGPPRDPTMGPRILSLAQAAPGIGLHALARAAGLPPAQAATHLRALEAQGALRVARQGLRRRAYPPVGR